MTFILITINCVDSFNPKRAGLFWLSQVQGGGGGGLILPPLDLGRRATKNSEIWHIRRVSPYERAVEIALLKKKKKKKKKIELCKYMLIICIFLF